MHKYSITSDECTDGFSTAKLVTSRDNCTARALRAVLGINANLYHNASMRLQLVKAPVVLEEDASEPLLTNEIVSDGATK